MTAAEIVARVKRVAPLVLASIAETISAGEDFHFDDSTGPQDELAIDDRAGFVIGDSVADAPWAVMSIALTKENTASTDALERALLASAATYDVHAGEYRATIGDDSYSVGPDQDDGDGNPRRLAVSDAEAQRLWETARDILIEHLLAPVEAR